MSIGDIYVTIFQWLLQAMAGMNQGGGSDLGSVPDLPLAVTLGSLVTSMNLGFLICETGTIKLGL